MANGEINATDLTEETTATLSGNEQFVMFDSAEGKRADIDEVATYIAGDKTQLQTTEKSSLVAAANELKAGEDDLKEDLGGRTVNLFNADAITHVYIGSSGAESAGNYYATSDYIDVEAGSLYAEKSNSAYQYIGFSWYDSNKTFLSRDNTYQQGALSVSYTAPNNAAYLRVSFMYGTVPTTWLTPEIMKSIETIVAKSGYIDKYFPYITARDLIARDLAGQPKSTKTVTVELSSSYFVQGQIEPSNGRLTETSTTRISSGFYPIAGASNLSVFANSGYKHRCIFYGYTTNFIDTTEQRSWHTGQYIYPIPVGAMYCRIAIATSTDSSIAYDADTGCALLMDIGFVMDRENQLYGKKMSILGDSLSTYGGINNYATAGTRSISDGVWTYLGNYCRYPQMNLLQNVSDCYWYKLLQRFSMTLGINESIAGSLVTGSDVSAICSETRIGHLDDNGSPDIILVNAGTNDIGHEVAVGTFNTESPANYTQAQISALDCSTFANAYRAMMIRLQYYYPDSIIVVLLPNYTSTYYTPDKADAYNEVIKEVCDYFGVFWIDARTSGVTIFNRAKYLPDGIHYNSAGMEMLYQNIKNAFEAHFEN